MIGFFGKHQNALRDFSEWLEGADAGAVLNPEKLTLLRAATKAIRFNADEYERLAPYCIKSKGDALAEVLNEPHSASRLDRALVLMACFIREASLRRENRSDSEQAVLNHYLASEFEVGDDGWGGYGVDYIRYVLPARLYDSLYQGLNDTRAEIESRQRQALQSVESLERRILGHVEQLEKLRSKYNFVGLAHVLISLPTQKPWRSGCRSLSLLRSR